MTDYFDSQPRASKRRRIATYKVLESGISGKENESPRDSNSSQISDERTGFVGRTVDSSSKTEDADSETVTIRSEGAQGTQSVKNSRKRTARQSTEEQPTDDITESGHTVSEHGEDGDLGRGDEQDDTAIEPRSSGRQKKRPQRYDVSPVKPKVAKKSPVGISKQSKTLPEDHRGDTTSTDANIKGILTPSKGKKRGRPPKSVGFDQTEQEIEQQLGFKKIEMSTKRKSMTDKGHSDSQDTPELGNSPYTPSKSRRKQMTLPLLEDEIVNGISAVDPDDFNYLPDPDILIEPITGQDDSVTSSFICNDDTSLLAVKSIVLDRLAGVKPSPVPHHLQTHFDAVHSLLNATITLGESNSLLLLGARGAGKSHILNAAISDLNKRFANDFHTVKLNGIYQTDDRLALREIWRQLGREMQVSEMEAGEQGGTYADTMSSLLSLLSHPDEFLDFNADVENAMDIEGNASTTKTTSKSIIFVLDEFDLFTTHPRQTLLYNLFDIAQSKKAPIAVIGCSTRMDVVDCLEKRVKSRFSHRWIHIPSAKTLDEFNEVIKTVLTIEPETQIMGRLKGADTSPTAEWNKHIRSTFMFLPNIKNLIGQVFYTTNSVADAFALLWMAVATVDTQSLSSTNTMTQWHQYQNHSIIGSTLLVLLPSLPTLHLSLVIAAARLDTIHNLSTLNFNLVYAHYSELITRSRLQATSAGAVAVGASVRQWNRDTAQSAWEDLAKYELIVPASSAGIAIGNKDGYYASIDNLGGEGASVRLWRVDVSLEELEWSVKEKWADGGGTRDILTKWCKEI